MFNSWCLTSPSDSTQQHICSIQVLCKEFFHHGQKEIFVRKIDCGDPDGHDFDAWQEISYVSLLRFRIVTKCQVVLTLPVYDTCSLIRNAFLTKKSVLASILITVLVHRIKCSCTCHVWMCYRFGEMFVLTCVSVIRRKMTLYLWPIFCVLALLVSCFDCAAGLGDVIYAINAGGETHTDSLGVRYERDPLQGKVGTASSYGKRLLIGRVPPNDQILYQTERYHHSTFGYDIPINEDGDYVMILKFCEVYFNAPNMKVSSRGWILSQRF